jgi:MFS family permease
MLFSGAAVAAAVGHHVAGPLLQRWSPRVLITASSALTAVGLALLVAVPSVPSFAVALAVSGAAIGVGMTAAYTCGGALLPPDAHATGFGVMTTASLLGLAVSPIVAGFISGPGLRVVFEADVVLLILLAAIVWAWMSPTLSRPSPSPDPSGP